MDKKRIKRCIVIVVIICCVFYIDNHRFINGKLVSGKYLDCTVESMDSIDYKSIESELGRMMKSSLEDIYISETSPSSKAGYAGLSSFARSYSLSKSKYAAWFMSNYGVDEMRVRLLKKESSIRYNVYDLFLWNGKLFLHKVKSQARFESVKSISLEEMVDHLEKIDIDTFKESMDIEEGLHSVMIEIGGLFSKKEEPEEYCENVLYREGKIEEIDPKKKSKDLWWNTITIRTRKGNRKREIEIFFPKQKVT